ncbi:MAG: hypothetical protein V4857_01530 [Pseudomonadota bacterium]
MTKTSIRQSYARLFLLGFTCFAWHAEAQSLDGATKVDENEKLETRDLFPERSEPLSRLDDNDRRKDGKYGWDIGWGPPRLSVSPTFTGTTAKAASCNADLTVIATARVSRTFLSLDETNIVTRTTFDVNRVLSKRDRMEMPPASLRVYLNRGELEIEGKVVKIAAPDYPEFKQGEQFVIMLYRKDRHFKLIEGAGVIRNGRVYYPNGSWRNVKSGIRLDALISQVAVGEPNAECN